MKQNNEKGFSWIFYTVNIRFRNDLMRNLRIGEDAL